MDQVGVPADSELRRVESIFFLEDIQEILGMVPPSEQLPTIQAPNPEVEISKGARVGEEAQPPVKVSPSEDALTMRDMVSQAKDAEARSKADDVHSEAADPQKNPS